MGFSDSWWHLLVTLDSGTYSCFVRAGAASLYLVEGDSVPQLAHISNPDNSDRLNPVSYTHLSPPTRRRNAGSISSASPARGRS